MIKNTYYVVYTIVDSFASIVVDTKYFIDNAVAIDQLATYIQSINDNCDYKPVIISWTLIQEGNPYIDYDIKVKSESTFNLLD